MFRPISSLASLSQNTMSLKVSASSPLHQTLLFSLEPILLERTPFKVGRRKEGSDVVSKSIRMTEHLLCASAKELDIYCLRYFSFNSQGAVYFNIQLKPLCNIQSSTPPRGRRNRKL